MELWRIADWLKNDKKQLKVKQSRVYWALCGKNRHKAFSTNGRARGLRCSVDFNMHRYLFLASNGQGIPLFGTCLMLYQGYAVIRTHDRLENHVFPDMLAHHIFGSD